MDKVSKENSTAKIIKDKIDIVDIIGEEVVLKQSGSKLKGLSPFNEEKTPSFFVDQDKQLFYCFSSNKGGDIIDFVIQTKGMNFKEAISWLANKKNISLPKFSFKGGAKNSKEEKEIKALLKLNKFAAHFFQEQLQKPEGEFARNYIKQRDIPEALQISYAIGFAPNSFNSLKNYLLQVKAPISLALKLGLLKTKKGEKAREDGANVYDAFRNRLIFPIRNKLGEIIGFGGRTLDNKEPNKYLNSPESFIYKKNQTLYNMDRAKKHIREKEEVLFVEGYMDCIAMEKANFPNVVATLGTSLSTTQAKLLCHSSKGASSNSTLRVVGLYDGDKAGKAATLRNMDIFLQEEGYPVSAVFLPENLDPDDFLRREKEGSKKLKELVHKAPAVLDEWIWEEIAASPESKQGKLEVLEKISEKLALLKNPLWIEARVPNIASRLFLGEKMVLEAVLHMRKPGEKRKEFLPSLPEKKKQKSIENRNFHTQNDRTGAESKLLDLLLRYEIKRKEVRESREKYIAKILELIKNKNIRSLVKGIAEPLHEGESDARRMDALLSKLDPNRHPKWRAILARALVEEKKGTDPEASLEEVIENIEKKATQEKKRAIVKEIKEAEIKGDIDLENKLLSELGEIEKQHRA